MAIIISRKIDASAETRPPKATSGNRQDTLFLAAPLVMAALTEDVIDAPLTGLVDPPTLPPTIACDLIGSPISPWLTAWGRVPAAEIARKRVRPLGTWVWPAVAARAAPRANAADAAALLTAVHAARAQGFGLRLNQSENRMLAAMRTALAYYRASFGPYQFSYARIVEFPGYAGFAQAFAGTVPYSERIGFIADARGADRIDYVTYVTAHELAHQYWAHQVISADMQGGTLWVETMAQYSALMVMKSLYGPDKIRRFLKYELDDYLGARRREAVEEQPLARVENQQYIHYNKGSVALYLLQDRLGEARVNAMLRGLLARYRFKGRPYPRSTDLVAGFASLARDPRERQLVADLFDRIVLWDFAARDATTRRLPDGRWETLLTVSAAKFVADGQGVETPVPFADTIDIGAFAARPGLGAFSKADVLAMERRPLRTGEQQVRIVTAARPAFVGVDPYNKYIDRNSDDNLAAPS